MELWGYKTVIAAALCPRAICDLLLAVYGISRLRLAIDPHWSVSHWLNTDSLLVAINIEDGGFNNL